MASSLLFVVLDVVDVADVVPGVASRACLCLRSAWSCSSRLVLVDVMVSCRVIVMFSSLLDSEDELAADVLGLTTSSSELESHRGGGPLDSSPSDFTISAIMHSNLSSLLLCSGRFSEFSDCTCSM